MNRSPSETVEEQDPDPLRPSPWRVLLQATSLCYDHLGLTLAGSCAPFLAYLLFYVPALTQKPGTPIFLLSRFILPILPGYAIMAGPVYLAHRILFGEDPSVLDLIRGWKRWGLKALLLGFFNAAAGVILAGDVVFLLSRSHPLLWLAAIPFAYALLFWLASQIYQLPLAVIQGLSPLRSFKQAHLLALANPGYTGALFLITAPLAAASFAVSLPLLVTPVWFATAGALAVRDLVRKYEALGEQK
jgi:uncharacterized membrane protein YesL